VTDKFLSDRVRNRLSEATVEEIVRFRDARHWRPFHNLKDLSLSLTLEAAELLECFQWTGENTDNPAEREHMAEELADVLIYAVLFADRAGFDLDEIVKKKLQKNLRKYPAPEPVAIAPAASGEDSLALPAVRIAPETARAFYDFLTAHPVGEWTSDPEGRFVYVAYARETLDFWKALEAVSVTAEETPETVNRLFAEGRENLTPEAACVLLARLLRLERMRDGLFLEAQSRGVLARWVAALL